MSVRLPSVAGQFYEADPQQCLNHVRQLLPSTTIGIDLPGPIRAGIVPHAGWGFSGQLAARVFAAIHQQQQQVDTFVIFGAVHRVSSRQALVYESGSWQTPLGQINIDEDLAETILKKAGPLFAKGARHHAGEHSIEVQVPFIQHLFKNAKILPILLPPVHNADEMGRAVGKILAEENKKNVVIASTDLTHYGPSYGFTPMGTGPDALQWAKEKNDQFFIDQILSLHEENLVETANIHGSACGAGAVAAALAAVKKMGAQKAQLLGHTTSAEIMEKVYSRPSQDAVGYAAIILG